MCKRSRDPQLLRCTGLRYAGTEGAKNIVADLTQKHSKLSIHHIGLDATAVVSVIKGLEANRDRLSSSPSNTWGLEVLAMNGDGISDAGAKALVVFAAGEQKLRTLNLSSNAVELRLHVDTLIHSINASHLTTLDLSRNPNLIPSGVAKLFGALHAPHLDYLNLSSCGLGPTAAETIAEYLRSRRSRNLRALFLEENRFGLDGTRAIVDALELSNFTLLTLDLMVWALPGAAAAEHETQLLIAECERVTPLTDRNWKLAKRTRTAVLRCLPLARILLNANPNPLCRIPTPCPVDTTGELTPSFPFLDLPVELQQHVVRHTSQDADALSHAQFFRLVQHATFKKGGQRRMQTRSETKRVEGGSQSLQRDHITVCELKDNFLHSGGFHRWESEV